MWRLWGQSLRALAGGSTAAVRGLPSKVSEPQPLASTTRNTSDGRSTSSRLSHPARRQTASLRVTYATTWVSQATARGEKRKRKTPQQTAPREQNARRDALGCDGLASGIVALRGVGVGLVAPRMAASRGFSCASGNPPYPSTAVSLLGSAFPRSARRVGVSWRVDRAASPWGQAPVCVAAMALPRTDARLSYRCCSRGTSLRCRAARESAGDGCVVLPRHIAMPSPCR